MSQICDEVKAKDQREQARGRVSLYTRMQKSMETRVKFLTNILENEVKSEVLGKLSFQRLKRIILSWIL